MTFYREDGGNINDKGVRNNSETKGSHLQNCVLFGQRNYGPMYVLRKGHLQESDYILILKPYIQIPNASG